MSGCGDASNLVGSASSRKREQSGNLEGGRGGLCV